MIKHIAHGRVGSPGYEAKQVLGRILEKRLMWKVGQGSMSDQTSLRNDLVNLPDVSYGYRKYWTKEVVVGKEEGGGGEEEDTHTHADTSPTVYCNWLQVAEEDVPILIKW